MTPSLFITIWLLVGIVTAALSVRRCYREGCVTVRAVALVPLYIVTGPLVGCVEVALWLCVRGYRPLWSRRD